MPPTFLLLFFIIGSAMLTAAAPVIVDEPLARKEEVKGLTVQDFDAYVGILKMFKNMLPNDLMSTLDHLNITQKGELVSFITDWFQDKIQKPTTNSEILEMLKNHLPSVHERIAFLNSTFYTKFNALKPETQTLLREWRDKAVNLASPVTTTTTTNQSTSANKNARQQLALLQQFAKNVQTMDPMIREDLRSQFPSAVSLTEGVGFTVFTTIVMVFQKILESVATTTTTTTTTMNSDCRIPLD